MSQFALSSVCLQLLKKDLAAAEKELQLQQDM